MTASIPNHSTPRNFQRYRYSGMVRTDSNGAGPRFADRNSNGQNITNAFQFGENHNSLSGYNGMNLPEGHIYEEVGPPMHPPPYFSGVMETRAPHHAVDHHFRGSPASLCSRCSVRCGHQAQPPSLPACNCVSAAHTMQQQQQPFCNIHGSISQHQMQSSSSLRTLSNGGHCSPTQCAAATCTHPPNTNTLGDQFHHGVPCTLHPGALEISNQRYTAGTMTPETAHHNDQIENDTKTKDSNRSLSPFAFLRKNNRDSKVSTNNMLDNSSGKSVLMCNRKWLVAIVLTLVLIVVLSVAVGLVVTLTVQESGKGVTTGYMRLERETNQIRASLRVVGGSRARYTKQLGQKSSPEFHSYARKFADTTKAVLLGRPELGDVVDYAEVSKLSDGSVIVDFVIHLKKHFIASKAKIYAKQIKTELYLQSNTSRETEFKKLYTIALNSIAVEPLFKSAEEATVAPAAKSSTATTEAAPAVATPTTGLPPTTLPPSVTTTEYTLPPASHVCQPITSEICQQIHYNDSGTTFPNFVGHTNQEQAEVITTVLNAVMTSTSCYSQLNTFSCALLVPKCGEGNARIPPCRSLCEAAVDKCGRYMAAVMTSLEAPINCTWFPNSTDPDVCVSAPVQSACSEPGSFTCDNQVCHPMKDRCDSVKDCRDEADERDCGDFQCVPGQFQCRNKKCRPKVWRCDGRDDCGDGSDEDGCAPVPPCSHGEFKCTKGGHDVWNPNGARDGDVCIDAKFTCDNTNDCSDGSDEDSVYCKDRH